MTEELLNKLLGNGWRWLRVMSRYVPLDSGAEIDLKNMFNTFSLFESNLSGPELTTPLTLDRILVTVSPLRPLSLTDFLLLLLCTEEGDWAGW